jgi:hypothetical protein
VSVQSIIGATEILPSTDLLLFWTEKPFSKRFPLVVFLRDSCGFRGIYWLLRRHEGNKNDLD